MPHARDLGIALSGAPRPLCTARIMTGRDGRVAHATEHAAIRAAFVNSWRASKEAAMPRLTMVTILAMLALSTPAAAQDLCIGLRAFTSTVDPHFHHTSGNRASNRDIFDSLVWVEADFALAPGLALTWTQEADHTGVF
jgi:peptide/nickel transport system substrate-binding protein